MASQVQVRRRVSYEQLESLWEFLNTHKEIALGYNKSSQAREFSKRMWMTAADLLNSHGDGATKDWKGWSSYWVDYKSKLKKRVAALRASQHRTGGGPAEVTPLTDVEKKFISILGDGFGTGLPNVQVDPFPNAAPSFGPVASPAQIQELPQSPDIEIPLLQQEITIPLVEEEVNLNEDIGDPRSPRTQEAYVQGPSRRRRSRHRSQNLTQDAARRALLDTGRRRVLLEESNNQILNNILMVQQQSMEVWQNILLSLNRIASSMERLTGIPEPVNERPSD